MRRVTSLSPQNVSPKTKEQWFYEGYDHSLGGRDAEALVAYKQAIQLDPQYVFAYYFKGNALNKLQRYEEALAAYDEAIRLDQYVDAYVGRGNVLRALERYEEALAAYNEAIRLSPQVASAYDRKILVLEMLDKKQEADEARKKLLSSR